MSSTNKDTKFTSKNNQSLSFRVESKFSFNQQNSRILVERLDKALQPLDLSDVTLSSESEGGESEIFDENYQNYQNNNGCCYKSETVLSPILRHKGKNLNVTTFSDKNILLNLIGDLKEDSNKKCRKN